MWLKEVGFVDKVKNWWDSYSVQGTPSFILASKLKALKVDLKIWNSEEFGNVTSRKNELWAEMKVFDELDEMRPLSTAERDNRIMTLSELENTILMEEICWRQKS